MAQLEKLSQTNEAFVQETSRDNALVLLMWIGQIRAWDRVAKAVQVRLERYLRERLWKEGIGFETYDEVEERLGCRL
jgi:hypothetical protein